KCQMYIDGVAETLTVTDANPAFTVKYTGTQHGFMANITDGSAKWAGSVGRHLEQIWDMAADIRCKAH
ncbi:MAG: hypothetical protein EBR82_31085, partial [Caulobacteraceae bacterium]|nr:hypothetical protein [Caulobacteraceae bacterium]